MSSVNKVIILGNLGADPEVRTFQNGGKVCNLRIATSQKWKDRDTGEAKERTEWHTVAIFAEGIVRVADQYLRKGSKVYIEGALETRKWQDQSGNDRYSTEVVVRPYGGTLVLLGDSQGGGRGGGYDDRGQGGGYDDRGGRGQGGGQQGGGYGRDDRGGGQRGNSGGGYDRQGGGGQQGGRRSDNWGHNGGGSGQRGGSGGGQQGGGGYNDLDDEIPF